MEPAKTDPVYVEHLKNASWFTADFYRPYLVKAAVSVDHGYSLLVSDLEKTYFCAGDKRTLMLE